MKFMHKYLLRAIVLFFCRNIMNGISLDCQLDNVYNMSREEYVDCYTKKYRFVYIIVVTLFLIFFGFANYQNPALLAIGVAATLVSSYLYIMTWIPYRADVEYGLMVREIESFTDRGMSRDDAIREVKRQRLLRDHLNNTYRMRV